MKQLFTSLRVRGIGKTIYAIKSAIIIGFERFLRKEVTEVKAFDYKMLIYTGDPGISRTIALFGERELEHRFILENILENNMNVLELGANIGYYALLEQRLAAGLNLHCYEPVMTNFKLLKANMSLYSTCNYYLHNKAISDKCGSIEFVTNLYSNMGHVAEEYNCGGSRGKVIEVETEDIAHVIDRNKIDLIRMDIEGHETTILRRLSESLRQKDNLPYILFETHNSRYTGKNSPVEAISKLIEMGYTIKYAATSHKYYDEYLRGIGFKPIKKIRTDGTERAVYKDLPFEILRESILSGRGFRTILLGVRK